MLAAHWLVEGYDSPVRTITTPYDELPWRGYWEQIRWAVGQMDKTHTAYASAQHVLEVLSDVPDLWDPGRGTDLVNLLEQHRFSTSRFLVGGCWRRGGLVGRGGWGRRR